MSEVLKSLLTKIRNIVAPIMMMRNDIGKLGVHRVFQHHLNITENGIRYVAAVNVLSLRTSVVKGSLSRL